MINWLTYLKGKFMIKLFDDLKDIYKICIKKHIHAYNSKTKTIQKN